jgi:lipopolysaccharide transport system ATP-binding protein
MNGAILGMTKAEIDKKFDEIVKFAEMEKFIDTPVKRYSSGMYVKLAFSVAAHLDSEIMIMDEVLAVGDVNFQQKCLQKMRKVAKEEGRTVLYVSHNMATIKTLCDRCIVLKKGQVVFDGDVDEAINVYSNDFNLSAKKEYDFTQGKRIDGITNEYKLLKGYLEKSDINLKENLNFSLDINACKSDKDFLLRYVVFNSTGNTIGTAYSKLFDLKEGNNSIKFTFSTKNLTPGKYMIDLILCQCKNEAQIRHDIVIKAMAFNIEESEIYYNMKWRTNGWGNIKFDDLETREDKNG